MKSDSDISLVSLTLQKVKSVVGEADEIVWGFNRIAQEIENQPDSLDKQRKEKALAKTEIMYGAILYFIFFVLFVLFVLSVRSSDPTCLFGSAMNSFLSGGAISTKDTLWAYLNGPVLQLLQNAKNSSIFVTDTILLVGNIEIRQFRYGVIRCPSFLQKTANLTSDIFENCVGNIEINEPFNPANISVFFPWSSTSYWGILNYNSGPHNSAFLPLDLANATEVLQRLKDSEWIDRFTKSIIVVVNVFDLEQDQFGQYAQILEQNTGIWYPSSMFTPLQSPNNIQSILTFVIYLISLIIICLLYIRKFLKNAAVYGTLPTLKTYWVTLGWELVDTIFCFIQILFCCFWIVLMTGTSNFEKNLNFQNPATYQSSTIDYLVAISCICWILLSLCVAVFSLKSLQYFEANSYTAATFNTVLQAAPHILALLVVTGVVWFCIAFAGTMVFSPLSIKWRNWIVAFFTTWDILTGSEGLNDMRQISPILGPLFYIIFTVLMTYILLNMFIGVFTEFYTRNMVPEQPWKEKLTFEEKIGKGFNQCLDYMTHSSVNRQLTPEEAIALLAFKTYSKLNLQSFEEELKLLGINTSQKLNDYFNEYLLLRQKRDLAGIETGDLLTFWNLLEAKLDDVAKQITDPSRRETDRKTVEE